MKKVLIIDTSILCVRLDVPGMETCGPDNDKWDKTRVDKKIAEEEDAGTTFVLPLATIIESGNHITRIVRKSKVPAGGFKQSHQKVNCLKQSKALAVLMKKAADQQTPWAAFADQSHLWSSENLKSLADSWPSLATQGLSLGDATIKDVAEYYAQMGCEVEILTGDGGLKAYEPIAPPEIPRRRPCKS